jgi:aspartate racemase
LVQVFFALQNTPEVRLDLPGIAVSGIQPEGISSKFDLALLVAEENHGLRATVEYSTDLFDEGTVQRLAGHYETLLAQIVRAPDTRLADLHLLTPAEQDQFDQWNDTAKPPVDTTVHMLVTAQARRSPSSVAVSCAGRQLTYAELDSRANQLARVLRDHGAGTERLVGVCMDRSIELPVALLAVLKSGSAYLPLEPTYPNARLVTVIDDARPSIIVSTSKVSARLPRGLSSPVLLLDNDLVAGEMAAASPAPLPDVSHPDNLAYVMYTSGSTGSPKGVAVTHRGIVRLTTDAAVAADDVFLLLSTFAFDASTWEIWCSLGNGARLAVFPPDLSPIDNLETVLRRERVTMLFLTTGLFHELVDGRLDILRQVRHIWAGGDVMSVPAAERALAGMPETRVTNVYGPTETVTYSTTHLLGPATTSARSVPIGEPVANTQIHVLDGNMNRVPAGVPGELYVGGDKVARGYLDRPMLTAERFVPNPFGVGRLYRTGDRARYRPDGSLDFLGRLDNQVKIRGYRVEPEEIEAALRRHPLVQEAVVTVLGNDSSARVLVGTVLSTVIGTDRPDLRSFLAERLPEFMVPTRIRILQSVPMTPSGKVDRLAIARQEEATPMVADAPEPPADGVESALAGIWAEVLGTGAVGVQQNFFELGGNSLLLARVRNRIQDLIGRDVPLIEFFRYPTVAELARYLAGSAGPAMKIGGGHEQLRAGRERASRLRTLRSSGAGGA